MHLDPGLPRELRQDVREQATVLHRRGGGEHNGLCGGVRWPRGDCEQREAGEESKRFHEVLHAVVRLVWRRSAIAKTPALIAILIATSTPPSASAKARLPSLDSRTIAVVIVRV